MKRFLNFDTKQNLKKYKIEIDKTDQITFLADVDENNLDFVIKIPDVNDADYIEKNGLIATLNMEPEALYAMENKGSYIDDEEEIHIPLILEQEQQIVCYLQITVLSITEVSINWLGTASEWQGQGFAKLFLLTLLAQLKNLGVEQIELTSSEEGLPLYLKCGFLPTQEELLDIIHKKNNLLEAINDIEHYLHVSNSPTLRHPKLELDFNNTYCSEKNLSYVRENSSKLAKISIDPKVHAVLKNACVDSIFLPDEENNQEIFMPMYGQRDTFFNSAKKEPRLACPILEKPQPKACF